MSVVNIIQVTIILVGILFCFLAAYLGHKVGNKMEANWTNVVTFLLMVLITFLISFSILINRDLNYWLILYSSFYVMLSSSIAALSLIKRTLKKKPTP